MADDATTDPPAEKTVDEKLADLKDDIIGAVKDMIAPLQSSGPAHASAQQRTEDRLDRPGEATDDLAGMIDKAITKAIGDRDAATAEDAHRQEHEKLAAATAEVPPVERHKRHRFMGWGEPS